MTSGPSNEDRDRLRLQAWTQRNQESCQTKEQNIESAPLFGEPYKRNTGDELSNWIQRMLGNFDDNTIAGPFIVPSSSNFPLTNNLHPRSDPPYKSPKGPCANQSLRRGFNSPKYQNEDESQASGQDSQLIHSTPALRKNIPHSPQLHSLDVKSSQFASADEPQCPGSTENTSSSSPGNNMQFLAKDLYPQLNRTFSMSHSQAFNAPLSCKQTKTAVMQKPTAYVRPMDGPEVVTESLELKPSPEHCTRLQGVILNKSIQEKTLTSEIQCVEHVLSEMTCSWPPLLSGIHSPCAPSIKRLVKVTDENPPKRDNGHLSSETPLSLRSSQVDSESDSENGTDPPLSNSPKREPAPVLMPSGDWQLDKWVNFSQQNYRRKSQWAAPRSPTLSLLKDGLKPSSVCVSSPDRDTSNLPSLNQKTVDFPTAQLSSTQENHEHQRSHKSRSTSSPLGSPLPTDPVNHVLEDGDGGVGVNSDLTLSREQEPGLKERPKIKSHRKRSKNGSVVFESEVTTNHNKDRYKNIKSDHCAACINSNNSYSDHITPACCCGKSKGEAKLKGFANMSQKDKHLHGCSQDSSKGTLSLVVKIDLNLLSKLSRTLKSPEIKLCTKDYKKRQVTNSRKNDKGDQYCPKKKLQQQGLNPSLHTARLENSNATEATEKRSTKKDEIPLTSSAVRDCSHKSKKHKLFNGNAHPLLNKEEVKCANDPKKNAGKTMEKSTATKLFSDRHRPLLRFEDRHYPVKHYIKEAKRLKHKADTEMDKLTKIFHYLDGALFFIESGIAMEKDPQISMSSYTMFAETVELIKFVLNLTNSEELSPTESDILALCLKCQALLQMAMFHTKEKAAISYSKTLTDHFNSSSPSPPPSFGKHCYRRKTSWSPTNPLSCSGPALCGSAAGFKSASSGSVWVPQNIGQVALTYVNITTLFLSAHDLWEQAEEFTNKGNGLLAELNKVMGALSLTSSMSSMVCYIRQGLHWLQMDCIKVK